MTPSNTNTMSDFDFASKKQIEAMTDTNDLRIAAEYMGAELNEAGQWMFQHGHQPTKYYREDATHIEFRYDSDFNWQVKLFSKVLNEMAMPGVMRTNWKWKEMYHRLQSKYFAAIRKNDPAAGFKIIIESIKWLQAQKGK